MLLAAASFKRAGFFARTLAGVKALARGFKLLTKAIGLSLLKGAGLATILPRLIALSKKLLVTIAKQIFTPTGAIIAAIA